MELDDEVCLCFHVTLRKLRRFLEVERPRRASQLSHCQGAGTGCGWCRSYLQRLFDLHRAAADPADGLFVSPAEYAEQRAQYIQEGKGIPPQEG